MDLMISEDETPNYETFRDCVSELVLSKLSKSATTKKKRVKGRKNEIKPVIRPVEEDETEDAEELGEFIEVNPTADFRTCCTSTKREPVSCNRDIYIIAS